MKERNQNLDLIKCIACLGVVGLHSVGMVNYTIYYLCDFSVPLFFMVNGFLMFSKEEISYGYAFRKILNLIKVVVLWNLLIMLPVLVFRRKIVNPVRLCLESLFQKGYLWHFWFFGALMLLYLFLPLLHKLLENNSFLYGVVCLLLMCICILISDVSMVKGYSLQMFVPQTLRLWTWMLFFLFGGLCYTLLPVISKKFPLWIHGSLALLFTILSNMVQKKAGLYLIHNRLADLFYDNITSTIWYAVLFTFLLRLPVKQSLSGLITRLSSLTMGIFILHPILLAGIRSFYVPANTGNAVVFWGILTVISGVITYIIIKVPVVKEFIKL